MRSIDFGLKYSVATSMMTNCIGLWALVRTKWTMLEFDNTVYSSMIRRHEQQFRGQSSDTEPKLSNGTVRTQTRIQYFGGEVLHRYWNFYLTELMHETFNILDWTPL